MMSQGEIQQTPSLSFSEVDAQEASALATHLPQDTRNWFQLYAGLVPRLTMNEKEVDLKWGSLSFEEMRQHVVDLNQPIASPNAVWVQMVSYLGAVSSLHHVPSSRLKEEIVGIMNDLRAPVEIDRLRSLLTRELQLRGGRFELSTRIQADPDYEDWRQIRFLVRLEGTYQQAEEMRAYLVRLAVRELSGDISNHLLIKVEPFEHAHP